MFTCPNCKCRLVRGFTANGVCWSCDHCGGQAMGTGLLRKTIDGTVLADIWSATESPAPKPGRPCAICSRAMIEVEVQVKGHPLPAAVCRPCEFIWFDAGEFELIPTLAPRTRPLGQIDETTLPLDAREALAMIKVREIAKEAKNTDGEEPDEAWKAIPAALGFPVEMDSSERDGHAWTTYIVSAIIAVVSVAAFFHLKPAIDNWGLIPAEMNRHDGLTLLTSFFLHGGVLHLVGNLYFLVVFGSRVETYLGWWRWLAILLLATLIGDLLHVAADPMSTIPCIGASGGISGLITFYALKFPHESLGILLGGRFFFRWIQLPAWSAFLLWVIFQVWGAYQQVYGYSNVSSIAHLGGTAVGVAAWLLWRNLDAKPVAFNRIAENAVSEQV